MMLARLETIHIGDDEIQAVRGPGGEGYAVVRRICEALGIDTDTQIRKLKSASWAVPVIVTATALDGKNYECFCLHVKSVPMWLAGIDAGRVAINAREKLELFQDKAADALYRWASGAEVPPKVETPEAKLLAGVLWLQEKVKEQERQLTLAHPKIAFHDHFAVADGNLCLRDAAKQLGRHPKLWLKDLRDRGYLYRGNDNVHRPYSKWIDSGYFQYTSRVVDGHIRQQTLVTPKGMAYFGSKSQAIAVREQPSLAVATTGASL